MSIMTNVRKKIFLQIGCYMKVILSFQGEYHECDEETNSPPSSSIEVNGGPQAQLQQPPMQSFCTKLGSAIFHKKNLGLNVFLMWVVFCIPGNIVAVVLYLSPENVIDPNYHQDIQPENGTDDDNQSHFQCHEIKNDWEKSVAHSKFAIQGMNSDFIISFPCANFFLIFQGFQYWQQGYLASQATFYPQQCCYNAKKIGIFIACQRVWPLLTC